MYTKSMSSAPGMKRLRANQGVRKREVLLGNFLGGLAWGLGSVIGATIIVAMMVWVLNVVGLFDFVKDYFPENTRINVNVPRSSSSP